MPCIVLLWSTWDSIRTQLSAWAEPILAVLGILTLAGAVWSWWERRRTVNLQVASRARRVLRMLVDWSQYPATIAATDTSPGLKSAAWRDRMVADENEVEELLEEMLDLVGGGSFAIQRATRAAYRFFLLGSDLINKVGTPQHVDAAATHFADAQQQLAKIVPKDLL